MLPDPESQGDPESSTASWRRIAFRPFAGMTRIRFEGFGLE
jgi:hypothetical protein